MGKNVAKEAEKLGFISFPLTIVYAQPRRFRPTFSTLVCDTADTVRDYLKAIDRSLLHDRSGGARSTNNYYLTPQAHVYVEVIDKVAGFNAKKLENHVNQINIFSKYRAHVINLVSRLDDIFPSGMLRHVNWDKVEKKFGVLREDAIETWKELLSQVPRTEPTPEVLARIEIERKETDRELELDELDDLDRTKSFKRTLDKYRD